MLSAVKENVLWHLMVQTMLPVLLMHTSKLSCIKVEAQGLLLFTEHVA